MLGWVVKALVGRGEGTRSSGAKRNGVAVLCVWCGAARCAAVGGRARGGGGCWRWYRFLCLREIQNDGYKPPRHVAVFPSSLSLSLSCTIYLSPISLFLSHSLSHTRSFSHSLTHTLSVFLSHPSLVLHTLAEGSTRSSNTRVHNRARPYASVREIHTYTRVSHERREPTVQPHLAYRGGRGGERG